MRRQGESSCRGCWDIWSIRVLGIWMGLEQMIFLCTVYTGYYKAWFIWREVVRILGYMVGMSNVGWMIHMEGAGKDVGRLGA